MNSLKGLGAFVALAGIAVAVNYVAKMDLIVLAVTVVTIITSVFIYAASKKRLRKDKRIAASPNSAYTVVLQVPDEAYKGMRRTASSRLRRYALAILPVVIVAAAGSFYAMGKMPILFAGNEAAAIPLTVRYRTDTPDAKAGKPWLEVINTSAKTVVLADVKLRYYFSADGSSYGANCFQTALRCSNITHTIGEPSKSAPGADRYLMVGFTSDAGSLAPGQTTQGIGLQFYRLDHKTMNQQNDHSFDAKVTHYAPSKSVTAYVRGALSWGEEPGPHDSEALTSPPAVTGLPAGVMFDNFHYTGPSDPALAANGWKSRTEGGGPGILGSWSPDAISFPADETAMGGQALQLRTSTDGTKRGTRQAELLSTGDVFSEGTLAARIYINDKPGDGRNGDHINETFCAISSSPSSPKYSELDFEYQPNGGWGAKGPKLDLTSWRSAKQGDRATRAVVGNLQGWHIVMLTVDKGAVTYSVDGRKVFSSSGKTYPRELMRVQFSTWLVDLPFAGKRTWDMRVNWIYSKAKEAMSLADVEKSVKDLYAGGVNNAHTTSHR
ncbi:cellulose binding domain-containing protein [Krasilnikovia sp. MM14-A1259]|uniref:cellulose binding domain-containing protein n=1 Tax=Krasilnikovia sp. MM14-A1259 TaxID=3373539 RepID=UPI003826484F